MRPAFSISLHSCIMKKTPPEAQQRYGTARALMAIKTVTAVRTLACPAGGGTGRRSEQLNSIRVQRQYMSSCRTNEYCGLSTCRSAWYRAQLVGRPGTVGFCLSGNAALRPCSCEGDLRLLFFLRNGTSASGYVAVRPALAVAATYRI
jgi:hypothetical protein